MPADLPKRFRTVLPFGIALLVLLIGTGLGAAPAPAGQRELDLGREAYARREYPAAVEHLQAAIRTLDRERERPSLAEAYLDLGLSYMAGMGEPERALAALRESAELAENPANALFLAAMAAEKLGRTGEAAALRDRALHPAPPPKPMASPMASTTPSPAPAPAAAPAQPGAFEHFFGKEQGKPATQAPAQPAPEKAAPPAKEKPKEQEKEKEKAKAGTAFDHFFKKPPETPEPPAPAPPPPPGA